MNSDAAEILNLDLNTCSDEVNSRAKELMTVDFESRRLKPGDEGYEWNKEVEFQAPEEDNEWDED